MIYHFVCTQIFIGNYRKNLHLRTEEGINTVILYSIFKGGYVIENEEADSYLPEDGRVLVTRKNGKVTNVRIVHDDEHVASLNALFELAKLAGYTVIKNGEGEL